MGHRGHHFSMTAVMSTAFWAVLLPTPAPARASADASVPDAALVEPAPLPPPPEASRPARQRAEEKEPEMTRKGLVEDLAWARTKYSELRGLRADSLAGTLAGWLRVGEELPVWVTDGERRCAPDTLKRLPNRRESDMSDYGWRFGPAGARLRFVLRGCRPDKPDGQGHRRRVCVDHAVGHTWWTNNGEVFESEIDGRWRSTGGRGTSDPVPTYGVLSQITGEAARYRGYQVSIATTCDVQYLRCRDGGYRECTTCDTFSISVDEAHRAFGHGRGALAPRSWNGVPCDEPCPKAPPQPDRVRLERLNALGLWVTEAKRQPFAGLYRSAEACRQDAATFRGQPTDHGEE